MTTTTPKGNPSHDSDLHEPWIRRFGSLRLGDVPVVGGKNASLGEMIAALTPTGIRVPDGFATTADAYRAFLAHNDLDERLVDLLSALDDGSATLEETGRQIRSELLAADLQPGLVDALREAYRELGRSAGIDEPPVAVRSSATAEDLPEASFAGQQESFLNVVGEAALLDAAASASPRSSPTVRSPIGEKGDSTIYRWRSR